MLEMPEFWDNCPGALQTGSGSLPRERRVLQLEKLERQGRLSPLTSDTEQKDLEFALLGFGLALVQYFLTMLPFLCFRTVIYILCHYMLEVSDLVFFIYFYFIGDYS